jgi:molybdopterin converting factor subunit 1
MTVRVKLFAAARELAGCDELAAEVAKGATVADVRREIVKAVPAVQSIMAHSLWAVDAHYAEEGTVVNEASEVALIPPVSGG